MNAFVKPYNEVERVKALLDLKILDTPPEDYYDDVVGLAAMICGAPAAVITFLDETRLWVKASHGIDIVEMPRELSFCSHTILSTEPMVVRDAATDQRFFNNPMVTEKPNLRFYTGIPLALKNGLVVGCLCVFDFVPRTLTALQLEGLQTLARTILADFELRQKKLEATAQKILIVQQLAIIAQSARLAALGEMAAGIAHEIANPLSIIRGHAEFLEIGLGKQVVDVGKLKGSAAKIDETTLKIKKIISGVASFTRDGKRDPFLLTSAQSLVNETVELCRNHFEQAGIKLIVSMPTAEVFFTCRDVQVSQVLLNLMNNAFDAISKLPEKWVEIKLETKDGRVVFRVTDSGTGIPTNLRDKIMEPFFTTKPRGKGTGLGLSLSNDIVKSHQGIFEIDHQNPNTSFLLSLPIEIQNVGDYSKRRAG